MKPLTKIFSIFFLLLYTSFVFRVAYPLIDYAINYTYITEELCEQKDNPNNECHGSCHLADEIAKQVNPQNENRGQVVIIDFVKVPHLVFPKEYLSLNNPTKIIFSKKEIIHFNFLDKPTTPPPKIS